MNLQKWWNKIRLVGKRGFKKSSEMQNPTSFFSSPSLQDLLFLTRVHCEPSLESIVEATQKKWLRPVGKERWESVESYNSKQMKKIHFHMKKMGFFSEVLPSDTNYDYALVLGASFSSVQERVHYLVKLWHKGVRFQKLIFLTGERPLDPKVEPDNIFMEASIVPKTETQMMQYVHDYFEIPEEMKQLPFELVSVPFDTKAGKRPSTADTIRAWMDRFPFPGKCLFVSNQPYCIYQGLVIKGLIPKNFVFETVGPPPTMEDMTGSTLLDTVARSLYQELQNRKKGT